MSDYYLNVPDEATFNSLKGKYPFAFDGNGEPASTGWEVDVIGVVYKAVSWNEEGEPTMEAQPGFLINLRSEGALPEALDEYQIFPETPVRVWA